MKMLDVEKEFSVWNLQLYLSVSEAQELQRGLEKLLLDPEANEHMHVMSEESGRELSYSIVTTKKMEGMTSYSKLEQKVFLEK